MKLHKTLYLFGLMLCLSTLAFPQQNSIVFSYDAGGKMIERKLQVLFNARIGKFDSQKDSLTQLDMKVFPNPTNSYVFIEGDLPEKIKKAELTLLNMAGQLLKHDLYYGISKSINVSDLKPGLYLLEIRYTKESKSVYKIIVTN